MRINWNDPSVRFTGRWSLLDKPIENVFVCDNADDHAATSTAPGSWFEVAFQGEELVLEFDVTFHVPPVPHLWISVDGGAWVEAWVDRYVHVTATGDGNHIATVIFKSAVEVYPRWYPSHVSVVSFVGYLAKAPGVLPVETRKLIEFLGDSITEGILIDEHLADTGKVCELSEPIIDDSMATYAAITARMLNMRSMVQAYGSQGTARIGCASVPPATETYPYVYDRTPYTGEKPDCIVINHGTNDRRVPTDAFCKAYTEYLQLIRRINPDAVMVCLTPFCGAYENEIHEIVDKLRAAGDTKLHFVSGANLVPPEPLHPDRAGHRKIAEYFAPILKDLLREHGVITE